ncbi:alpha-hydroxy acid oxidase [Microbulbifer sp. SA54]|uniref:alpha-hydroxy acid oxidase n=1 Tax=Microbulbifer sp. SA54 TaxID=3401577 RepID=UPI003AAD7E8E
MTNQSQQTGFLENIPVHLVSAGDYEQEARQRLSDPVWAQIAGGAGDELTLRKNRSAFDALDIIPRLLADFRQADTGVHLFGRRHKFPLLIAPIAHQQLLHPQGELATLAAANALETTFIASTLASTPLETIAAESEQPSWFQLYFQPTREQTLDLLQRAEAAGYEAIVVTLDAPISGLRNRVQRAGFTLPAHIPTPNTAGYKPPAPRNLAPGSSVILNGFMADAPRWEDLQWLREHCNLPLLAKGVLSPADAEQCRATGLDGIIVSNHGGRTLDGLPATIDVLPAIRAAVGNELPLLLDSGIRRGTDIFKALALGADAVLLGRPYLYALATAGALGVAHLLRILREELEIAMALSGRPDIRSIQPDAVTGS